MSSSPMPRGTWRGAGGRGPGGGLRFLLTAAGLGWGWRGLAVGGGGPGPGRLGPGAAVLTASPAVGERAWLEPTEPPCLPCCSSVVLRAAPAGAPREG